MALPASTRTWSRRATWWSALGIVLLLSWLSAAAAGGLSARLHWRIWITLPLVLLPALIVELILLLIAGIVLAELGIALS